MSHYTAILRPELDSGYHVDSIYKPYLDQLLRSNVVNGTSTKEARMHLFNRLWLWMYRREYNGESHWHSGQVDQKTIKQWHSRDKDNNNAVTNKVRHFMHDYVSYIWPAGVSVAFVELYNTERHDGNGDTGIRQLITSADADFKGQTESLFSKYVKLLNSHDNLRINNLGYINSPFKFANTYANKVTRAIPFQTRIEKLGMFDVVVLSALNSDTQESRVHSLLANKPSTTLIQ